MNKKKAITQLQLGRAEFNAENYAGAATIADLVLRSFPKNQEAKELLADVAFRQNDFQKVVAVMLSLLKKVPNSHIYHNKIAVAYAVQEEFKKAAIHLRRALKIQPDYLPACLDFCKVATQLGEFSEAVQAGVHAVKLAPQNPKTHDRLASAYEVYGFYDKAREHYEIAAKLSPDDALRQYACGMSLLGIGDKASARKYLEKATVLFPKYAPTYHALSRMNKYSSPDHEDFNKLKSLLEDPELTENNQAVLHFSLGKMYEDCKLFDQAIKHFDVGNKIENQKRDYRPEASRDLVTRLITSFSGDFFSKTSSLGHSDYAPLFIVGMPRSGTTLIEQILASHPKVFGAGELPWFIKCAYELPETIHSSKHYPECIVELDDKIAHSLGQEYLDYLVTLAGSDRYKYIINKWPDNYERVGLIARMFPNARFIHCQRDPLDNLISQYTLLFPNSVDYSYSLFNLGAHHTQYKRLMRHWENVLADRFFHIQYEDLVQDQEAWTRKLLDFLELPWDSACMNFYKSDRVVRTYSDDQVRKPMYSSSVARWKNYEKHLEPLHRGLRWSDDTNDL